jgi:hypothetical protein
MSWNIKTPGDYINGPLTVAGNTTITGAATVGTTLGVTGQSTLTGNVGIGTAPSYSLHVKKDQSSPTQIYVDNQQNNAAASSELTLSAYGGFWNVSVPHSATFVNPLIFKFGTTEVARLTSVGNLAFPIGKGIDFSAVTGGTGTATANVLNDYEEGTFTPVLTFGGASVGITYSNQTFRYTKIGRVVTVNGYISLTSKGSSTGQAVITGLPFTIANSFSAYSAASLWSSAITPAGGAGVNAPFGVINTATMNISTLKVDGTYSNLTNGDFANNSELMISLTYTV